MAWPGNNKFRAKRTEVNGIVFASKKEAARYSELKLLERAGEISGLELQPVYQLIVNDELICKYIGDFRYVEKGRLVVEDVKSEITRKLSSYRIKRKLMKAIYAIEVKEV